MRHTTGAGPTGAGPAQDARESPGSTREPLLFTTVRRRLAALAVLTVVAATVAGSVGRPSDVEPTTRSLSPIVASPAFDDRAENLELARAARAARASAEASASASASAAAAASAADAAKKAAAQATTPPAPRATAKSTPKSTTKKPVQRKRAETAPAAPAGAVGTVVAFARAQVGKRYVFGTAGPNTFDCSGLVKAAYLRVGISLPHQTGGLAGRGRSVSRAQLAPGDLVFPSSGHVGIYVGGGQMVHASTPRGGVKLSSVYKFSFARRIL